MRAKALAAALFALAPMSAAAQVRELPAPLGPLTLAMSTEDVRSATPGATWAVVEDEAMHRGTMRSQGPALSLHGVDFQATLTYAADAVSLVRLAAELPLAEADCAARHRAIVEAEAPRRQPFMQRRHWHRFYEHPDGPVGVMQGETLVPAASFDATVSFERLSDPGVQPISGIAHYEAPAYGQQHHRAGTRGTEISASYFTRDGAPVCRIIMQITHTRGGGFRPSNGPSGSERLAERLATARFFRPVSYFLTPDPDTVWRSYPTRALEREAIGDVVLNCLVLADGLLDCAVRDETPLDMEFGAAALRIAAGYRADVFAENSAGMRTEITIRFRV